MTTSKIAKDYASRAANATSSVEAKDILARGMAELEKLYVGNSTSSSISGGSSGGNSGSRSSGSGGNEDIDGSSGGILTAEESARRDALASSLD